MYTHFRQFVECDFPQTCVLYTFDYFLLRPLSWSTGERNHLLFMCSQNTRRWKAKQENKPSHPQKKIWPVKVICNHWCLQSKQLSFLFRHFLDLQVQDRFKQRTSSGGILVNDTLMHLRLLTLPPCRNQTKSVNDEAQRWDNFAFSTFSRFTFFIISSTALSSCRLVVSGKAGWGHIMASLALTPSPTQRFHLDWITPSFV